MTNKEINDTLRKRAIALGLCKKWQGEWREDWSEEKMIEKYKEGLDFCLENGFPGNEFIKENFNRATLIRCGVFVDEKRSVMNMDEVIVAGKSEVRARYNMDNVGTVWVTDDARVTVWAKNRSHVIVHAYARGKVEAVQMDGARLLVIRHSKEAEIMGRGEVEVKEEME